MKRQKPRESSAEVWVSPSVFVIVGMGVVAAAVLLGFILEGGNPLLLMQWAEFLIIGGTALGALLISTPKTVLIKISRYLLGSLKSSDLGRESFLELLQLLYEVFQTARVKGLLTLEEHIEKPTESELLAKYPVIMKNHHAVEFLTDSLKLLVIGGVPPLELELLLDADLEVQEEEGKKPAHTLARMADSLPGMGIVAAVLGIVITMQAIGGPASEVGHKVAAALVGTFLGVLLCYGFIQPLSAQIEHQAASQDLLLKSIKAGIVAYAKGMPPIVAVEFARRVIVSDYRPGYDQVEAACRAIKVKAK
uniref:Flagellar motor stator protein MotA n=1 Tax=Desulfobacca acetoxidans TaxID=60893 RepID=A0A7C3WHB5_9BACT